MWTLKNYNTIILSLLDWNLEFPENIYLVSMKMTKCCKHKICLEYKLVLKVYIDTNLHNYVIFLCEQGLHYAWLTNCLSTVKHYIIYLSASFKIFLNFNCDAIFMNIMFIIKWDQKPWGTYIFIYTYYVLYWSASTWTIFTMLALKGPLLKGFLLLVFQIYNLLSLWKIYCVQW